MEKKIKIKSFEDACKVLHLDPTLLPDVTNLLSGDRAGILAFYKLTIIIRALNEGWVPDYSNWNQPKYYVYVYTDRCGLVAAGADSAWSFAYSDFGARLALKSRELAEYMMANFLQLYKEFLLFS